ncbi:MAG: S-adenosylhomocysteine deaminase [Frankiales bacterium]|nr:S-adenosylhomocysteine deaminase [Frankiales bacterium]
MTLASPQLAPVDLLVAGASLVATVDDERTEIAGGWVAVTGGLVSGVGPAGTEPQAAQRVDASGCLVTPGLVNTHHHMWQNLTRSFAPMTNTDFLGWLGALYPLWTGVRDEDVYLSTRVALAELAMGGCTTTSDHLYLQPPKTASLLDAQVIAARESGLRLTATRGSVDRGQRDGSPMPDDMLEDIDDVLADCDRVISAHHDPSPGALVRIALGPHSVFGATTELMARTAELAAARDVRLHTHLSGDSSDEAYCLALHGMRPVEWFASAGWLTDRAWVAHALCPSEDDIRRLGAAGVGVAQCATAGLLMGIGVAPIAALRAAGSPVGLAVDGSSNSDASSLWMEARMALIANRSRSGPAAFAARDILDMATRDGARCLGRAGEIGQLTVGANADIAVWPIEGLRWAGAVTDPIEAWLRCGPNAPRDVYVGGRAVVTDGALAHDDLDDILPRHRTAALRIQQC